MPVGIAPQKQKDKGNVVAKSGSLAGSFAASMSSSVGIYSQTTRSSHSFRLKEPDSPGRGTGRPPSRQSRAGTPKFNEKERAVIANLDQLSPEVRSRAASSLGTAIPRLFAISSRHRRTLLGRVLT